jgi:ABC-type sulfate transport system permease component
MRRVRKGIAILAAVLLVLLTLVMLILMLGVTGLPLCDDRAALRTADECIEASSGERFVGLVAGWASVLVGLAAAWLAVRYARSGTGAPRFTIAAAFTPVLGLLAVAFLPVSF